MVFELAVGRDKSLISARNKKAGKIYSPRDTRRLAMRGGRRKVVSVFSFITWLSFDVYRL